MRKREMRKREIETAVNRLSKSIIITQRGVGWMKRNEKSIINPTNEDDLIS